MFLGAVAPILVIGSPVVAITAFVLTISGLRIAAINLDHILTSLIPEMSSVKKLKPRIAALPNQALLNSGCKVKPTEIPEAMNLVSHDLKYDDVVNMQDVTGLDRVDFRNVLDLGQTKPRKGKLVRFLDKFGDAGSIDEMDTLDAGDYQVPEKRYLRTRN